MSGDCGAVTWCEGGAREIRSCPRFLAPSELPQCGQGLAGRRHRHREQRRSRGDARRGHGAAAVFPDWSSSRSGPGPAAGWILISFLELHEALAAARERLDELSRAAEAVAASGELQRELAAAHEQNQQLRAEIDAVRAERDELAAARQAAAARVEELTREAEQATASAQEIDQELIAVRWQNAQLNTNLAQARAKHDEVETEARETQAALQARIEELEAAAAAASAEAVRLRAQLGEKEQQIAAVAGSDAEADRQMSEWRDRVRQAEQAKAAAEQRVGDIDAQLADTKGCSRRRSGSAPTVQRLTALERERDGLRSQLGDVRERGSRRAKRPAGSSNSSSTSCARPQPRPPIWPAGTCSRWGIASGN